MSLVKDGTNTKTVRIFENILGTKQNEDGIIVANYHSKIIQVSFDEEQESAVIQIGKLIPGTVFVATDLLEHLNNIDCTGQHLVTTLKNNMRCYIYRTGYEFDDTVSEEDIQKKLELDIESAESGFRYLVRVF